jgi:hypothetical protein
MTHIKEEYLRRYLKKVPRIIRNALKSLSNDNALCVFLSLLERGGYSSRASLKRFFDLEESALNEIIEKLEIGGLVRQYVESIDDLGNDEKTFCEVTKFGRLLWINILDTMDRNVIRVVPNIDERYRDFKIDTLVDHSLKEVYNL